MKAILIDDEVLVIRQLEKMLTELACFTQIVTFQKSADALAYVLKHPIDVAFLDIEMPGIDGMTLARKLQAKGIHIIFVTAYDHYAIQAFEIDALDYIVKPITRKRLEVTVKRLLNQVQKEETAHPSRVLHCLGDLKFIYEQKSVLLEKWRTKKTKALFCFLLQYRNKLVTRDVLIDTFWPDIDLKRASVNLHSTIYQIRKTLDSYQIPLSINRIGEGYQLDMNGILLDVDVFDTRVKQLSSFHFAAYEEIVAMYEGDYLQDGDYVWAEGERMRLRNIWLQHAYALVEFYNKQEHNDKAILLCHRIQQIDPYDEKACECLIDLYEKIGNNKAAKKQKRALSNLL